MYHGSGGGHGRGSHFNSGRLFVGGQGNSSNDVAVQARGDIPMLKLGQTVKTYKPPWHWDKPFKQTTPVWLGGGSYRHRRMINDRPKQQQQRQQRQRQQQQPGQEKLTTTGTSSNADKLMSASSKSVPHRMMPLASLTLSDSGPPRGPSPGTPSTAGSEDRVGGTAKPKFKHQKDSPTVVWTVGSRLKPALALLGKTMMEAAAVERLFVRALQDILRNGKSGCKKTREPPFNVSAISDRMRELGTFLRCGRPSLHPLTCQCLIHCRRNVLKLPS